MVIIRFTNLTVYDAMGRRGQNLPSYHFLNPKSLQDRTPWLPVAVEQGGESESK